MLTLAAAAILALGVPGGGATAAYAHSALSLTMRYEMTCGRPGPGPLVLRLPSRFRLTSPHAFVNGVERIRQVKGDTVTIELPQPHGITCMSITLGALKVRLTGVRAPRGTYTIGATLPRHAFAARLRVG